ncbi:cytochrome-c peroxidase [Chitinophagaceae bacterium MMS25-I14]
MRPYILLIAGVAAVAWCCFSFVNRGAHTEEKVWSYYDMQLDSLAGKLELFAKSVQQRKPLPEIKRHLLHARIAYKKAEFLVSEAETFRSRSLNGPDLMLVEEDSPSDTVKPHGLQVLEDMLYGVRAPDYKVVATEIQTMKTLVLNLRNNPDRKYQLSNIAIWEGLRYGVYRIIALGITGFDVPSSLHAIPETQTSLASMKYVTDMYKEEINALDPLLYKKGNGIFMQAIQYTKQHTDFNTFDRLTFIREYLNPLSDWLTTCAGRLGYFRKGERMPLNIEAKNLFAADIFNIDFFSPNDRYRLTPDRIALGKKLFYDPRLSGNNERSCASCHNPAKAFTDGLPKPMSIDNKRTLLRNTPTLWNVVFQTRQFYDSRTDKLENQLSEVVHNSDEMNGSLNDAVPKLKADTVYAVLFQKAYAGDVTNVSAYTIANAISCYVRSLVSFNSRFDRYMRRETNDYTVAEKNGFNLFMGKAKCGTCHYAPMFNGLVPPRYDESESEILVVPATAGVHPRLDADEGKFRFTKVPLHKYAFKTPTVRNIAITAPYMHNGVYRTLEEVIEFYNKGGGAGLGIQLETQTLPAEKLHLSKSEVKDIIAFLHTLTDTTALPVLHLTSQ